MCHDPLESSETRTNSLCSNISAIKTECYSGGIMSAVSYLNRPASTFSRCRQAALRLCVSAHAVPTLARPPRAQQ
jgi:hypothetical protein